MFVFSYARMIFFCCSDLDLDPTTLMYELELDFLQLYLHAENGVSR